MTFEEFKTAVITAAKDNGLKDYEIYFTESSGTSVEVFKDEIKEYASDSSLGICFKCIVNGKTGYAATENLSEEDALMIVANAIDNAGSIENDEPSFIHKKGDNYAVCPAAGNYSPSGKELTAAAFAIQKAAYAADSRVADGTQSSTGHVEEKFALINSNGLDLMDEASFDYAVSMALVEDNGEKYDGFEVRSLDLRTLDAEAVAGKAVEKAVSTIGASNVPTGKYRGILKNEVMYTFLSTYSQVFFGEAAQKGLSLLKGREGEVIAAPFVTLTDDPMEESSMIKRTFDGEGVATVKKNVIENGILKTLLYNLKSASVAGCKSTGNGSKTSYTAPVSTSTYSFYINSGEKSEEELCEMVGNGVMVTSISGLHAGANPITGDYSLLSEGFLIKDGKKDAPIKNFTISGNFFSLLKDIKVLGSDFKFSSSMGSARCGSPSVLLDEINVAGE